MSETLENINLSKFTSNKAAGSKLPEGDYYSLVGSVQHRVQQITLYLADNCIRRVSVKKFDQTCIVVGRSDGTESQMNFVFEPDEEFMEVQLYSRDGKLAGMRICTTMQNNLYALVQGAGPLSTLQVDEGSGRCVGVFGHGGPCVSSLGFAILKKNPVI